MMEMRRRMRWGCMVKEGRKKLIKQNIERQRKEEREESEKKKQYLMYT